MVLSTMKPTPIGFQKRLAVAFASDTLAHDDDAPIEAADQILQGCHDWMFKEVLRWD